MATFADTIEITVNASSRDYDYIKDVPVEGKRNMAGKVRAATLTDGSSTLTQSHEITKGNRMRSKTQIQETRINAVTAQPETQSAYLVVDQPALPNPRSGEMVAMVRGWLTWLLADTNLETFLAQRT